MTYPEHSQSVIGSVAAKLRRDAEELRKATEGQGVPTEEAAVQWQKADLLDHLADRVDPPINYRSAG
jgi:hypothetical protein